MIEIPVDPGRALGNQFGIDIGRSDIDGPDGAAIAVMIDHKDTCFLAEGESGEGLFRSAAIRLVMLRGIDVGQAYPDLPMSAGENVQRVAIDDADDAAGNVLCIGLSRAEA